jgi:L-iditol 2-dehydrogenase
MCTEYKLFQAGQVTHYLGHEAAGEVVEVAQASLVKVGDRVVAMPLYACGTCALCLAGDYIHCQQGVNYQAFHGSLAGSATMAEYLLKPDWLLVPIPEDVSYDHAALACCGLGATYGALEALELNSSDTLLITGLGPVGLGGIINARYRGARVIGVEGHPWRRDMALKLGAEVVLDPSDGNALEKLLQLTNGRGADKGLECSGVLQAQRFCIDSVRRKGTVAFVGEAHHDLPIRVSPDLLRKGLMLKGSWHYNLNLAPKLMKQIGELGPALDMFISHRSALQDMQTAWETQLSGHCAKVMLKPNIQSLVAKVNLYFSIAWFNMSTTRK